MRDFRALGFGASGPEMPAFPGPPIGRHSRLESPAFQNGLVLPWKGAKDDFFMVLRP
jgi:hypothetical protein